MRIDVLTLFPEFFAGPMRLSLLGKALEKGILDIRVTDIRDFTDDRHRTADDAPFGGGPGMVMKCEPLFAAVEQLKSESGAERVVLMTPRGCRLDQDLVRTLAASPAMIVICGRYEGVDERVSQSLVTDEVSIGDYVLSGGELPALVLIEAMSRMAPGVVGDFESVETDSFYAGLLGPPQYTRPAEFRGMAVPEVLREGNHAAIARWRRKEALRATLERRPDLLTACTERDHKLLEEIRREKENES